VPARRHRGLGLGDVGEGRQRRDPGRPRAELGPVNERLPRSRDELPFPAGSCHVRFSVEPKPAPTTARPPPRPPPQPASASAPAPPPAGASPSVRRRVIALTTTPAPSRPTRGRPGPEHGGGGGEPESDHRRQHLGHGGVERQGLVPGGQVDERVPEQEALEQDPDHRRRNHQRQCRTGPLSAPPATRPRRRAALRPSGGAPAPSARRPGSAVRALETRPASAPGAVRMVISTAPRDPQPAARRRVCRPRGRRDGAS
jgi:hypothetical protein